MDEYISREAVINITAETGAWETQNRVRELPTADVQPVKHGRWVVTKTERGWNCAEYPVEWTCSECNVANDREDDFCPHCGSYNRMGGDSE